MKKVKLNCKCQGMRGYVLTSEPQTVETEKATFILIYQCPRC